MFTQLDIAALFHTVLFAYQKTLEEIAGDDATSIVASRVMPMVEEMTGEVFPELAGLDNPDDALGKFADLLGASEMVREMNMEKDGERYAVGIDGCAFADHVHSMTRPKDVTCPWAIIAMAIVQKSSKRNVRMTLSEFTAKGSETTIEFL